MSELLPWVFGILLLVLGPLAVYLLLRFSDYDIFSNRTVALSSLACGLIYFGGISIVGRVSGSQYLRLVLDLTAVIAAPLIALMWAFVLVSWRSAYWERHQNGSSLPAWLNRDAMENWAKRTGRL